MEFEEEETREYLANQRKSNMRSAIVHLFSTALILSFKALIVMWLWNYLANNLPIQIGTDLISVPKLNFWHAVAIITLMTLLIKNATSESNEVQFVNQKEEELQKLIDELEVKKRKMYN